MYVFYRSLVLSCGDHYCVLYLWYTVEGNNRKVWVVEQEQHNYSKDNDASLLGLLPTSGGSSMKAWPIKNSRLVALTASVKC